MIHKWRYLSLFQQMEHLLHARHLGHHHTRHMRAANVRPRTTRRVAGCRNLYVERLFVNDLL